MEENFVLHFVFIVLKRTIFVFPNLKYRYNMEKEQVTIHSCVDCGTQNCKFKTRTYPEFCPTTQLKEEDLQWALERYQEERNHNIMVASAEVEYFVPTDLKFIPSSAKLPVKPNHPSAFLPDVKR